MSRTSKSKQSDLQAAPEVIPILEGCCVRLKRLLKLCDQQIDAIEQDTNTPSPNRSKEVQILVRTVLNLQKDLLKYTKALHPDIPIKQQTQTTSTILTEDLEALSDDQLREILAYYALDEDQRNISSNELIASMLDKAQPVQNPASESDSSKPEDKPYPTPKTDSVTPEAQSKPVDSKKSRQLNINHYVQGKHLYNPSRDNDRNTDPINTNQQQLSSQTKKPPDDRDDDPSLWKPY